MMGWLFYTDPSRVQGYAGEKAEITRICTFENDTIRQEPLKLSKVGSTWYVAVQSTPKPGVASLKQSAFETGNDGGYVFAAIILVKYDQGCFGYKDMDETMGPVEARAPMSLIKLLSRLKDPESYAQAWRAKCMAWSEVPKYATGDVIALGTPIQLTQGGPIKTVRKETYKRRGRNMACYVDIETGQRWRLSKIQLVGSKLVEPAMAKGSSVLAEFAARKCDGA